MNKLESNDSKVQLEQIKKKFLDYSKECLLYSTLIGLSNIVRAEFNLIKIIWMFFILGCMIFCLQLIISSIITYFNYGVYISIKYKKDSLNEFPAVTFCNLNPYFRKNSQKFLDQILADNSLSYTNDFRTINQTSPSLINSLIKSRLSSLPNELKRAYGFNLSFMLLTCYFNDIKCNETDFIWRYDNDYTSCYTFNSGFNEIGLEVPRKKISETGSDRSLRLELFLGIDDTNNTKFMANSGLRVLVHNQNRFPMLSSEGVDISTGFQTNIGLKQTLMYRLDAPYSKCIKNLRSVNSFDSKYYKAIFNSLNMTSYSQKVCLKLCLQDYILNKCDCLDPSLPNIYLNRMVFCQNVTTLECADQSRTNYYNNMYESSYCQGCPPECDSIQFRKTISSSRYPTYYYLNYMMHKTNIKEKIDNPEFCNENNITKSTVILNIYFDDLENEIIEEMPALTFDTLISNIGGNLGLFVGISVLSGMEVVEYILKFFYFSFMWCNLKQKINRNKI